MIKRAVVFLCICNLIVILCACSDRLSEYDFIGKSGGASENSQVGGVAENENYYYFLLNSIHLVEIDKETGEFIMLPDINVQFKQFNIVEDLIIYNASNELRIESIDGTYEKQLATGLFSPLFVLEEYVYYSQGRDGLLFRVHMKSKKQEQLYEHSISEFAIFNDSLFFMSKGDLFTSDLSGEDRSILLEDIELYSMTSNNKETLYFINASDDYKVYSLDLINGETKALTSAAFKQVMYLNEGSLALLDDKNTLSILNLDTNEIKEVYKNIGDYYILQERILYSDIARTALFEYDVAQDEEREIFNVNTP